MNDDDNRLTEEEVAAILEVAQDNPLPIERLLEIADELKCSIEGLERPDAHEFLLNYVDSLIADIEEYFENNHVSSSLLLIGLSPKEIVELKYHFSVTSLELITSC